MRTIIEAGRHARTAALLTAALGPLTLSGCEGILDAAVPSRVLEGALATPSQAGLLVNGVIGQLECAFGATTVAVGLITDELVDAQNEQAVIPYDKRDVKPADDLFGVYARSDCITVASGGLGVYTPLSSARWFADDVTARLETWTDQEVAGRQALIATAAAYAGYSLVLLGETMCSAALDGGPERSRVQLWQEAEARFTKAIAAAASDADLLNLARIGRARARVNQGKLTDAAADAAPVPEGYQRLVQWSAAAPIRHNRVFAWNNRQRLVSVDASFRGLSFDGVADPRVPVVNMNGKGIDGITDLWTQGKYTSEATAQQLASWEEAQLIVAEASGGQTAVGIINALHAKASLPSFASDDPTAIRAQVVDERRRELFLESHRLADMIRFQIPFVPAAGTPYPKTGVYGETTCLPLPDRERGANPNLAVR